MCLCRPCYNPNILLAILLFPRTRFCVKLWTKNEPQGTAISHSELFSPLPLQGYDSGTCALVLVTTKGDGVLADTIAVDEWQLRFVRKGKGSHLWMAADRSSAQSRTSSRLIKTRLSCLPLFHTPLFLESRSLGVADVSSPLPLSFTLKLCFTDTLHLHLSEVMLFVLHFSVLGRFSFLAYESKWNYSLAQRYQRLETLQDHRHSTFSVYCLLSTSISESRISHPLARAHVACVACFPFSAPPELPCP